MTRARQTLSICKSILESHDIKLPCEIILKELREIELSSWQGKLKDDLIKEHPSEWETWKSDPENFSIEGFNPLKELWSRVDTSWSTILTNNEAGDTLIVCHGALGKCMIQKAVGVRDFRDVKYGLRNCEAIEIIPEEKKWRRLYPESGEWIYGEKLIK